jgi:DNA-binding transcriptional LysR family regulator
MNLTNLHTFSLVAETGTISAAADRLRVPKSTVSRRVRRLEDALGYELLRRSPRAVTLTDHGKVLHQRTASSLREIQDAEDALRQSDTEPSGILRITTTPGFGQNREVVRCIKDFGIRYQKVIIDVELSNRLVNLIDDGFDIGLRLHTGALPGNARMMSRHLLDFRWAMYGSPAYLEEMGSVEDIGDLKGHRMALHSRVDFRNQPWQRGRDALPVMVPCPEPRWRIDDISMLQEMALAGAGLVVLETVIGDPWVHQGKLVRVLPELSQQAGKASMIWPASRHLAPRVRAFIDHAVDYLVDSGGPHCMAV